MKQTIKKPLFILAALVAIGAGVGASAFVSAQTGTSGTAIGGRHMMDKRGPGVMGTVSSVNGTTILVAGKDGKSYTVDASVAKFLKSVSGAKPTDATIADIVVGDTVGIKGTVTDLSVKAEMVMDGIPPMGVRGMPGVKGTVSAVNGTSVTFTVTDASTIKVGDEVFVHSKK